MSYTAGELAKLIDAQVEGDASLEVSGVAAPEHATPAQLIYVEGEKQAARATASNARCVVAPAGVALAAKTVLRAGKPKVAFAKAAAALRPPSTQLRTACTTRRSCRPALKSLRMQPSDRTR